MTERASPAEKSIVHQIYGPPGTGKTRDLTERVKAVVASRGPNSVVIASFSTTAAKEIASRGLGLPERAVGTLHSLAFRGMPRDETVVALDPIVLADWNTEVAHRWRITPDQRRGKAPADGAGGTQRGGPASEITGDELISALDKARATFTDPSDYPPDLAAFAKAWTEWKTANSALDFTDMIEQALLRARDGEAAPGRPEVFVVDEGQDNTPLEVELILNWGKQAMSVVVALDDDQAINQWRGGDPRRMLTLGDNNDGYTVDRRVLGKSYRIPSAVHAVAERWVRRLSLRQEKVYTPRTTDRDGVELEEPSPGAAWCVPQSLASPALIDEIEHEVGRGRSVMVVATCAYMLDPLISSLRNSGLPFHNPFRPSELRWNPLGYNKSGAAGMSTVERIARYMAMDERMPDSRLWTGKDIQAWLPLVGVGQAGLLRGVKAQVADLPDGEVPFEEVAALFADPEALKAATVPDLEWLANAILPSKRKGVAYPIQVARKRGPQALAKSPMVTVGTIHSVKGGAADVVYVAPDLSFAGMRQLDTRNGRDQMIRLFYVALTRAYEELRVLAPSTSRNYVRLRDLIPPALEVHP